MTTPAQHQGKLIYSSAPWKIYEQDAGMGERDYAVIINDIFYCRTEDSQTAMKIVESIRSRPHTSTSAPEQGTSKLCFGTITLVLEECRKCNEIESCKQKQSFLDYQKREIATEAAKAEREQVLKECCAQCPIAEEIPVEDYCAESCEGCLVRMVVTESLRAQQAGGVSE